MAGHCLPTLFTFSFFAHIMNTRLALTFLSAVLTLSPLLVQAQALTPIKFQLD
jgi:hypothetical protein